LSTAGVTFFDKAAVLRALDDYVRALAERQPEVEEVILFGSVAAGTPVPGSDVDLLIILRRSDASFLDRIPQFLPSAFPAGVDVFPYTREELDRMRDEGNRFVLDALRSGRTLLRR
jgi:predicted nucleotidyltransferase